MKNTREIAHIIPFFSFFLFFLWKEVGLYEVKSYALVTVHGSVNSAYFILLIQCLFFWGRKKTPTHGNTCVLIPVSTRALP